MFQESTSKTSGAIPSCQKRVDLIGFTLLFALWIWATFPGLQEIYHEAITNEESSHILLVPLIAGYIIWLRRNSLRSGIVLWERMVAPCIMLLGCVVSNLGYQEYWKSIEQLGWLIIALGVVINCFGLRVVIAIWPALFVMLFLIPVPARVRADISIPLQAWTAQITELILVGVGIPIGRMGSVLEINGIPVGIAEACNGARMVYAVFLICYAYAFTSKLRPWAMVTLLVVSPLVAILSNIIRVVPTVLMYGYASEEMAGVFHDLAGWGVVLIAFLGIHLLAKLAGWLGLPVGK